MKTISSYLKDLAESISVSEPRYDVITYIEFGQVQFLSECVSCLLLGYERGFQVWKVSEPHNPLLLLSKRNTGVSCIKSLGGGLLGFSNLYSTSESPRSVLSLYSCVSNDIERTIEASGEVRSFEVSPVSLILVLESNDLEIYSTSTWDFQFRIECKGLYEICLTASPVFLAWALTPREAPSFYSIKDYMQMTPNENPAGTVHVMVLESSTSYATIQAFVQPVSQLKLSQTSKILVVAPVTGYSFHVYSLNAKRGNRYTLIYTLLRGVTRAEISNIEISLDEFWVVVASAKGTCHVYQINPEAENLTYNLEVYTRVRLSSGRWPTCSLRMVDGYTPLFKQQKDEIVYEPNPPQLLCATVNGVLAKYSLFDEPVHLSSVNLLRPVTFREKDYETLDL